MRCATCCDACDKELTAEEAKLSAAEMLASVASVSHLRIGPLSSDAFARELRGPGCF